MAPNVFFYHEAPFTNLTYKRQRAKNKAKNDDFYCTLTHNYGQVSKLQ